MKKVIATVVIVSFLVLFVVIVGLTLVYLSCTNSNFKGLPTPSDNDVYFYNENANTTIFKYDGSKWNFVENIEDASAPRVWVSDSLIVAENTFDVATDNYLIKTNDLGTNSRNVAEVSPGANGTFEVVSTTGLITNIPAPNPFGIKGFPAIKILKAGKYYIKANVTLRSGSLDPSIIGITVKSSTTLNNPSTIDLADVVVSDNKTLDPNETDSYNLIYSKNMVVGEYVSLHIYNGTNTDSVYAQNISLELIKYS